MAKINVALLSAEEKIRTIPKTGRAEYENRLNELQTITSNFILRFREHFVLTTNEEKMHVKKLLDQSEKLKDDVYKKSFLFKFIEWVILDLNKYVGTDKKYILLINDIKKYYFLGNEDMALKSANNVLNAYKGYEK